LPYAIFCQQETEFATFDKISKRQVHCHDADTAIELNEARPSKIEGGEIDE